MNVEAPYIALYATDTCDMVLNNCSAKQTATSGTDYRRVAVGASYTSNLTVNSGTYESTLYAIYAFPTGCNITINGGTFTGDIQKDAPTGVDPVSVVIKGGTFSTQPDNAYVASGYTATKTATETGDVWVVNESN